VRIRVKQQVETQGGARCAGDTSIGGGIFAVLNMSNRSVLLAESAAKFIDTYEVTLQQWGLSRAWIEAVTAHIIGLLWGTVPKAIFLTPPRYVGPDEQRPGASIYEFSELFVSGKYSSTPDAVCVLVLELNVHALGQISNNNQVQAEDAA